MAKNIQLRIADPCHENWDNMTPVEKGRFCGSCQKQVIDFSSMSDRQVAEFFKKPSTGSVCGRFMTDQLDRSIEIPKKRIPWLKYFFQVAIPAFLLTLKASAVRAPAFRQEQTEAKDTTRKPVYDGRLKMGMVARPMQKPDSKKDTVVRPVTDPLLTVKGEIAVKIPQDTVENCNLPMMGAIAIAVPVQTKADKKIVKGRVVDQEGRPVAFASIQAGNEKALIVAAEDGTFEIKRNWLKKGNSITVSSSGYETLVTSESREINHEWVITLKAKDLLPEVIVTGYTHIKMGKVLMGAVARVKNGELKDNDLIKTENKQIVSPPLIHALMVYPNPVIAGATISLSSQSLDNGLHQVQFISQSGQLVQQKEMKIVPESGNWKFDIPPVPAGGYFLVITNKQNGSKYSAKLIVQ